MTFTSLPKYDHEIKKMIIYAYIMERQTDRRTDVYKKRKIKSIVHV